MVLYVVKARSVVPSPPAWLPVLTKADCAKWALQFFDLRNSAHGRSFAP
jgi:hypothetical protein